MDDYRRTRLWETMLAQRHAMVRAWHQALGRTAPALRDGVKEEQVLALVERFVALLLRDSVEAEAVREVGKALSTLSTEPEVLILSQEVLVRYLGEAVPPDELAALQPRLTRLFGEMAAGFYGEVRAEGERAAFKYFMNPIIHELRTPLSSILGYSRIMLKGLEGPLTEPQREGLTIIYQMGERLNGTINDLITLSKIRLGRLNLLSEEFPIQDLVHEVIKITQPFQTYMRPLQTLEVVCDAELGEMAGDKLYVSQVVTYLLQEVIRYSLQGVICLTVRREGDVIAFEAHSPEAMAYESLQKFQGSAEVTAYGPLLEFELLQQLTHLMRGTLTMEGGRGGSGTHPYSLFALRLPAKMAS